MKKLLMLLLVIGFSGIGLMNVQAKTCSNKKVLIKCVYTSNHTQSELKKITMTINKSDITDIKTSELGSYTYNLGYFGSFRDVVTNNKNDVTLVDFAGTDGKMKCPTVYINFKEVKRDQSNVYDKYYSLSTVKLNGDSVKTKLKKDLSCKSKEADSITKPNSKQKNCIYNDGTYILINTKDKKVKSNIDVEYKDLKDGTCPLWVCRLTHYTPETASTSRVSGYSKVISYNQNEDESGNPSRQCYPGIMQGNKYKCLGVANQMVNVSKSAYNSKNKKVKDAYEASKSMVLSYCDIALNSYAYDSKIHKTCINECLQIRNDIVDIEKKSSKGECVFSDRIIALIYNILKWMKYIAPVLVIVLGMLDFIKALAAQDDDAMKKAQGKFVKRLIAAALLFLLPLLIDYVLRIFGMVNSKCSITKIF